MSLLHKVIEYVPHLVDEFVTHCPHSCSLRDGSGRLPVHFALANGVKWSNIQHLDALDPVTGLCPSALAALEPACDLDTISFLLRNESKVF